MLRMFSSASPVEVGGSVVEMTDEEERMAEAATTIMEMEAAATAKYIRPSPNKK